MIASEFLAKIRNWIRNYRTVTDNVGLFFQLPAQLCPPCRVRSEVVATALKITSKILTRSQRFKKPDFYEYSLNRRTSSGSQTDQILDSINPLVSHLVFLDNELLSLIFQDLKSKFNLSKWRIQYYYRIVIYYCIKQIVDWMVILPKGLWMYRSIDLTKGFRIVITVQFARLEDYTGVSNQTE